MGLSSYYGKSFVDRSKKKANSSLEYVIRRLNKATIEPDEHIRDVAPGNVFDNYFKAPYVYSGLSANFQSFKAGQYTLLFNHKDRVKLVPPELLAQLETNNRRLIGQDSSGGYLVIDDDNQFHVVTNNGSRAVGDIFDIMRLDRQLAPVDFAEVKVFSKGIPVGLFIGYQIGLRKLIKFLKARHRIVEGKTRKDLAPYEYVVQFKDIAYIFDRRDAAASLILAGFKDYEKEIRLFDAIEFDSQDVYLMLLQAKGLTSIYLTEMDNLIDLFIDPITEQILLELGEPRTFMGLLIRACEMLKDYHYPASQDMDFQRIRGYERIAGLMYRETANAIRSYRNKNRTGRSRVDISPYQFWATFTRDASVKICEDINPIQALKGQEAVTYVGEGGRSKDSMNRDSRAYHKSNIGVLSEATVDSSDVGINAFLAADPEIEGVLGMSKQGRRADPSNLFSTSALLAPFSNHDDPKRAAFVNIQQAHTVSTEGYHAPVVRTGYESVIGHRTGPLYASSAKQAGKVVSVTESGIVVEYEDGTKKGFALGQQYGKAEGSVYPHNLVTDMVVGQTFKKGEYISYNTNFFERDPILPGDLVYKGSLLARIAMVESPNTFEDSSVISDELSNRLATTTTKVKTFTVGFKQNIHNIVKVGQRVKPEDVLMIIEDEITSMDSGFGPESMAILANLAKSAPKASYHGEIAKIEVFYHGEKTDMSSSLKSVADRSDRKLIESCKATNSPVVDGSVDSEFSVDGTPLVLDKAVIKIYINVREGASVGDLFLVKLLRNENALYLLNCWKSLRALIPLRVVIRSEGLKSLRIG